MDVTGSVARPWGVAVSAILLHVLNVLSLIFIKWNEEDTFVLASFVFLYVCFTAIVIHAYWKGQAWARWMILARCLLMLGTYKMVFLEGGLHYAQGVTERVLALILLVYLNLVAFVSGFNA